MINLLDKNASYLLISPEKTTNTQLENKVNCERICSILYSKGYTILPIQGFYNNRYEKSFLAFTDDNNDGSEKNLTLITYDSEMKDRSYLYNGLSFTFLENKKYFFPKKKEDLKAGMIIEYFNNNKWNSKTIVNLENEYEKMYKLLIKYEKLRVESL